MSPKQLDPAEVAPTSNVLEKLFRDIFVIQDNSTHLKFSIGAVRNKIHSCKFFRNQNIQIILIKQRYAERLSNASKYERMIGRRDYEESSPLVNKAEAHIQEVPFPPNLCEGL